MARLTLDEYATDCGMEKKNLHAYVGRGQVVVGGGMVDMDSEINRLFMQKQRAKKGLPDAGYASVALPVSSNKSVRRQVPRGDGDVTTQILIQNAPAPTELTDIDKQQRLLDIQKTEQEIIEKTLKNQKLSGSVVPVGVMRPLLTEYNKMMVESYKNGLEGILTQIANEHLLDGEQIAFWRGNIIKTINEASEKAKNTAITALEVIINEFSATRTAGQKA